MPPRKRPPSDSAAVPPRRYDDPSLSLEPFLHYLRAECGMAENTVKAYGSDLSQFFEWWKANGPAAIETATLKTFAAYLQRLHERQFAATSIHRHMVSIKMFFRFLVLEGTLKQSVADLLTSPKLWQHLPTVLSPERVNQLLTAPSGEDRFPYRDRALLCMLYATGCRASEVANIKRRDIHLEESYCRCVGKGNKERIVSLNPVAVTAVQVYLQNERGLLAGSGDDDDLFLTRRGTGMSRIMVWHIVKKYALRIGASDQVSPHTLRHSFATHMLAGGAEIRALQELLGHASIATTQIYTQVEHSRLKTVHQKFHPRG